MMMRKLEPDGKTGNYSVLSNIYQNRKYTFAIAIPTATIISGLFLHFNRLQIIPDLTLVVIALLLFIFLLYVLRQNSWFNILNKKLIFDEALYRSIFDQAPIGIAIMQGKAHADRPELVDTIINSTYSEILGRDENELRQMTWVEITHSEDLPADLKKFDQFKKGVINGYSMEKRFIKPDGSIVWTLMTVSPLSGEYNDHSVHLCLIKDITSQKSAEAALVESESKYRAITENMSDVVWQTDLDLKTVYISPSVEKILGESVEEHIRKMKEEKFPEHTLKELIQF